MAHDQDNVEVPFDDKAIGARLGLIAPEPNCADGEWMLLIDGADARPLDIAFIGLALDYPVAPIPETEEALRRAGYEYHNDVVIKPWAACWKLSFTQA